MTGQKGPTQPTEYHVLYAEKPEPRWEVRWGTRRMGYQSWDKRVALSAAKEMAKADRPSKIVVHSRKTGEVEKEIEFDASAPKRSKGVTHKVG